MNADLRSLRYARALMLMLSITSACADTREPSVMFDACVPISDGAAIERDATTLDSSSMQDAMTQDAMTQDAGDAAAMFVDAAVDASDEDANVDTNDAGPVGDPDCAGACGDNAACALIDNVYRCIECFDGNGPSVEVFDAEDAASLRGYRRLSHVTFVTQEDLPALLENLACAEEIYSLTIPETTDLRGLRNLRSVNTSFTLTISDEPRAEDAPSPLASLSQLSRVWGTFTLNAGSLVDLRGLEALEHVGDFALSGSALQRVQGLRSLRTVRGDLTVNETQLGNFAELDALEQVGGLQLTNNPMLTSMEGLPEQAVLRTLTIIGTPLLEDVSVLQALERVTGDLRLAGGSLEVPGFPDFIFSAPLERWMMDGPRNLTRVDGNAVIAVRCADATGFEQLRSVGGNLTIVGPVWPFRPGPPGGPCPTPDLHQLSALRTVGRRLQIGYTWLTSLDGLQLDHADSVYLTGNPELQQIDALASLPSYLPGSVSIVGNEQLTSLAGLQGITAIGGDLLIGSNWDLPNLDDLAGLQSLGGVLLVARNSHVPSCQVDALSTRLDTTCGCNALECGCNDNAGCPCIENFDAGECTP